MNYHLNIFKTMFNFSGMREQPQAGWGGWEEGVLAGQLCTDARTKDCKTYPLQCARHFKYDTPFSLCSLKNNPFHCSKGALTGVMGVTMYRCL